MCSHLYVKTMQGGYYNMMYDDNCEYSGGNDEYQSSEIQQDFSAEPADPASGIEESADVVSSVTGLKKKTNQKGSICLER